MKSLWLTASVAASVWVVGCGSSDSGTPSKTASGCTPATQVSCSCASGLGTMTCGVNGAYGTCACGLTGAAGTVATSPSGFAGTGFGSGPPATAGTAASFSQAGAAAIGAQPIGGSGTAGSFASAGSGSVPITVTGSLAGTTGGAAAGGGAGASGSGGAVAVTGGSAPKIPDAPAMCPTFTNGGVARIPRASGTMVPVTIYIDPAAKSKPAPGGPLIIYWHATASSPAEVTSGFGMANISAVTAAGGVVAAPATTACNGCTTTDDGYWFEEDDVVADQIVACAIKQANIDVTHIHTLGWSAGGLHTTHVAQARSNYIASFISYSGGLFVLPSMDEDPTNKVAGILTYGDPGSDVVILDFNAQSKNWYMMFQPMGWYSMMCHHPGGHEVDPMIAPLSLRFFKDHPFKVSPEPYATMIPSGYPSYCSNMYH
jgi:hypothetical protein